MTIVCATFLRHPVYYLHFFVNPVRLGIKAIPIILYRPIVKVIGTLELDTKGVRIKYYLLTCPQINSTSYTAHTFLPVKQYRLT